MEHTFSLDVLWKENETVAAKYEDMSQISPLFPSPFFLPLSILWFQKIQLLQALHKAIAATLSLPSLHHANPACCTVKLKFTPLNFFLYSTYCIYDNVLFLEEEK